MFAAKAGQRFSLLLLEEGESFVRDYVASADWPAGVAGTAVGRCQLPGQLRLATKSLFFEPDDTRVPIVRLPFSGVQGMEGRGQRSFELAALRWTKMCAHAAAEPFAFERVSEPVAWVFHLAHSSLADFLPLAQQMLLASRLPDAEQEELLEALCAQQEAGVRFDVGHLRSPGDELVLAELPARVVTPLVAEAGRLALTSRRLYFQPLHNWVGDAAARSHPLEAIAAVARRRGAGLRDVGLEVFFAQPGPEEAEAAGLAGPFWGAPSAFFSLPSQPEREAFLGALRGRPELGRGLAGGADLAAAASCVLEAEGGWLERVTAAWQRGRLSNFQYLLFLNAAAGRTFNDLSQYPVMPWVLADWTSEVLDLSSPASFRDLSKPVGALNPRRLGALKQRYRDMPHDDPDNPPFLYATHYSTPGYVLFWTIRAAPAHMLRLQSGRFDAPDRLFFSMREAWEGVVSTNPTDVKELLPEHFMANPDFLVNARSLPLGVRQSGRPVGDVELPPWAGGSPARFLALHRAALEAPFVSANLHHWIDLIFGYKQQGQAALEADNVFRHLTHAGAVDVDSLSDPMERKALLTAIQEFGQSPAAIFARPHVRRMVCPPPPVPERAFAAPAEQAGSGQAVSLALVTAVVAAATDSPSEPLEVPPLLYELDVVWAREQDAAATAAKEKEAAAAAAKEQEPTATAEAAAAEAAAAQDVAQAAPSESDAASQADDACSELSASSRQSSASKVKALLGGVRNAVTSPGAIGAASLRGLFGSRKAAGGSGPAAQQDARGEGSETEEATAAAEKEQRGRLQTSLINAFQSLTSRGSQGLPGQAEQAQAPSPETAQAQRQACGSSAATAAPPEPGVVWKVSRRAAVPARSREETDSGGSAGSTPALSPRSPSSPTSQLGLLEEQRQRMLARAAEQQPAAEQQQEQAGAWGPGLRERLRPGRVWALGSEAVNAVALAAVGSQRVAYAGQASGVLRVLDLTSHQQLRAAPLGSQPLTSIALLAAAAAGGAATEPAACHPLVLCGSYDSCIHCYQVENGRSLGSWTAHTDTVSCVELLGAGCRGPAQLLSASWDGTVRCWELEEGRRPWTGRGASPRVLATLDSGVWALAASGDLLLTGTEDGLVALLDRRAGAKAWEQALSDDYIGGLRFLPGPGADHAVAASGDGTLSLLDLRRAGARLTFAACGAPLHCLATDGAVAAAGGEGGGLQLWDMGEQLGSPAASGRWARPGPSGLYEPLDTGLPSAINALDVRLLEGEVVTVAGHEGGVVHSWSAGAP